MPLYEEKLISPLSIRFSQPRIRCTFRDGHTLEESLAQIATVTAPADSCYDAVLAAPFPPIEVVRWRPKLRDADGSALSDEAGESMRGEECWFTLDNRRLYCLQNAAAQGLPHSIAAVVRVMYDIPTVKSIARKFKTTTSGSSVTIAAHHDELPICTWGWQALPHIAVLCAQGACAGIAQMEEDVETRDHRELEDAPLDSGLHAARAFECEKSTDDSSSASEHELSSDDSSLGIKADDALAPAFVYEAGSTLRSMINRGPDAESAASLSRGLHQKRQQEQLQKQQQRQQQLLIEGHLPQARKQRQQEYEFQHQHQIQQQQLLLEQQQQYWLMQRQQELQLWAFQQQQHQQQHHQQQPQQPKHGKQSLFSQLQKQQRSANDEAYSGGSWEDSTYPWGNQYGQHAATVM